MSWKIHTGYCLSYRLTACKHLLTVFMSPPIDGVSSRPLWFHKDTLIPIPLRPITVTRIPLVVNVRSRGQTSHGWGSLSKFHLFRHFPSFFRIKTLLTYRLSHSYLIGVASAVLRLRLWNMNVIRNINGWLYIIKNIRSWKIIEQNFGNPNPISKKGSSQTNTFDSKVGGFHCLSRLERTWPWKPGCPVNHTGHLFCQPVCVIGVCGTGVAYDRRACNILPRIVWLR